MFQSIYQSGKLLWPVILHSCSLIGWMVRAVIKRWIAFTVLASTRQEKKRTQDFAIIVFLLIFSNESTVSNFISFSTGKMFSSQALHWCSFLTLCPYMDTRFNVESLVEDKISYSRGIVENFEWRGTLLQVTDAFYSCGCFVAPSCSSKLNYCEWQHL